MHDVIDHADAQVAAQQMARSVESALNEASGLFERFTADFGNAGRRADDTFVNGIKEQLEVLRKLNDDAARAANTVADAQARGDADATQEALRVLRESSARSTELLARIRRALDEHRLHDGRGGALAELLKQAFGAGGRPVVEKSEAAQRETQALLDRRARAAAEVVRAPKGEPLRHGEVVRPVVDRLRNQQRAPGE